ncbi:MAG: hypothetical protein [Olavius algarvensis Delta 4 endosymbiont]|nr:MAG: hypothetical protein [Olavius algarvensis Delta 4 endosymbiont]
MDSVGAYFADSLVGKKEVFVRQPKNVKRNINMKKLRSSQTV